MIATEYICAFYMILRINSGISLNIINISVLVVEMRDVSSGGETKILGII
jgi:hypothetical protein